MTANADPLQGSLFEDSIEKFLTEKPNQNSTEIFDKELNDKELLKDAVTRPRTRQEKQEEEACVQSSATENLAGSTIKTDKTLPNWSHHSMVDPKQLTPMLRHYVEIKEKNPDRILLYRLGDFFECFFEDALTLSRLLELTLTSKEAGKEIGKVPMAGIPHHASDRYCADLVKKGLSVALCDQLESTPSKGSLIKRDITRILTPGTVIEEGMLQARKNNWLASIVSEEIQSKNNSKILWGLASADVSTGEFLVTEYESLEALKQEIAKLQPSEIILSKSNSNNLAKYISEDSYIKTIEASYFSNYEAKSALIKHYQIKTINGLGIDEFELALKAAGGLIGYLSTTKPTGIEDKNNQDLKPIPLDYPRFIAPEDSLLIDVQTRRNLELTATQRDGKFHGSLLWAIDRTLTCMGGRCLRQWIEKPLINLNEIKSRQNLVSTLVRERKTRQEIRKMLRAMGDLERLSGRAGAGQAGARDIIAIADGIERLPYLSDRILSIKIKGPKWLEDLKKVNPRLIDLAASIRHILIKNPPLSLTEGGLIYDGVDQKLDGLRNQLDDQDYWLKKQEIEEKKLSGNSNLRIQYHRTFGYFLAVSKAKANQVPSHWIRRQTLANEERFITPALKDREGQIFQSKARTAQREYEIFCELRELVGKESSLIRRTSKAVAGLDALTGLAEVAAINNYCMPELKDNQGKNFSRTIDIEKSRHPVVEQLLSDSIFEPNDIYLGDKTDLIILTGPNASGKSCYLRQIGLIQLLAQIGSWVPATKASISIADRIFTRVGAVDDIATGQSTFMVEMAETAFILNQATSHSLVLLDEIGRGTATFDGLSIAWSVSEFLANKTQSRTVFATHYHELNELASKLDNIANFQVLVKETGKSLIFLHKVVPGGASRSYGIEAAKLAGVPSEVITRAEEVLNSLEKPNGSDHSMNDKVRDQSKEKYTYKKVA